MKKNKSIFIGIILLFASINLHAQSSIQPFDATIDFDKSQRACIQVNLDPEPKTLKKAWRNYLKDNYDFKLKGIGFLSNKDLLSAEGIIVKQISPNALDFYTHIVEDANGSEMKVFVRYGYDIYLTKENTPNDYIALTEIINSFLKYYLPIYYEEKIYETENRINGLTRQSKYLKEQTISDSERIEKLKKEVIALEEKVEINNRQLEIENWKLLKRNEKLERIRKQLIKL